MRYLLSHDLSDFEPQEILATKMKCGENGEKLLTSKVAGKKFSEIVKLRESGLGDIKEFSDIPQPDLPKNEITDIRIFNVPETIFLKIIPLQPEHQADRKNTLLPNISEFPVTSTSRTSKTIKLSDSPKLINEVVNMPSKETSDKRDPLEPINQESSAILLARQQRKDRLRKRAVEFGENPDVFVTITEKDRLDSIAF
ncbi:hypothetical protein RhiirC2_799186 [Rhizophagus irregularis]|uniref:Uncharacterized protein n=1 Tax=Rhizophagus irregularis TaxID=588596 RepID=A0A2N1M5C8_9GLOM|nr:hypothetical protein RhiirC2_799186 [Rhizophagus irregularis]